MIISKYFTNVPSLICFALASLMCTMPLACLGQGTITTVAGTPGKCGDSGDGGPAATATMCGPSSLTFDAAGNLYVEDFRVPRIRRISPAGIITTVVSGFTEASGVAVDQAGNIYSAYRNGDVVYKATPAGSVSIVAGVLGGGGTTTDGGLATQSQLVGPIDVAIDSAGDLLIAELDGHRIRKVTPAGIISTVVGDGHGGYAGDGGPGQFAEITSPTSVVTDGTGNLYICDNFNSVIRKVNSAGIITTIAGGGTLGGTTSALNGDGGPATKVQLWGPNKIALDTQGNLFISENYAVARVRKVDPAGTITTVAGNGIGGYSGDGGPALSAELYSPEGLAVDKAGNLFIADFNNYIIREVTFPARTTPVITDVENGASFVSGLVANAWLTIKGSNFSTGNEDWSKAVINGKLPTSLGAVSVSVNGQPAYIQAISSGQINAVAPDVPAGPAQVTVTTSAGTSAPFSTTAQIYMPAFFLWPGGYAVATHVDYTPAVKNGTFGGLTTIPAKPGETIILWGSGFGPTNPAMPVGVALPADTIYYAAKPVTVTVGGTTAQVLGAALGSGDASAYLVAIQVPSTLADGDYPVVATVNGVLSPATTLLTVQH